MSRSTACRARSVQGHGQANLAELGTANLNSIPQPQISQNCKRCSATANPQVCDRFAVTFRTSATANATSATANFRNLRPQYLLLFCLPVMIFLFWRSNFAVDQTLTSKKKVINTQTLTSNLGNKVVHFSNAFYSGTCNTAYCFADLP